MAIELLNVGEGHINEIWKLELSGDRLTLLSPENKPVSAFTTNEAGEHITLPNRLEGINYLAISTDGDDQFFETTRRGEALLRRVLGDGAAEQQAGLNALRIKGYLAAVGGLVLMAVGIVVTVLSFMDERNEGGVVWWGIVVVGLFVLIGGVAKIWEHRHLVTSARELDLGPAPDFNETIPADLRVNTKPASALGGLGLIVMIILGIAVLIVIISFLAVVL